MRRLLSLYWKYLFESILPSFVICIFEYCAAFRSLPIDTVDFDVIKGTSHIYLFITYLQPYFEMHMRRYVIEFVFYRLRDCVVT